MLTTEEFSSDASKDEAYWTSVRLTGDVMRLVNGIREVDDPWRQ